MRYEDLTGFVIESWKEAMENNSIVPTICILGRPGIGKSALGKDVARRMTAYVQAKNPNAASASFKLIDLTSSLPEDFAMPMPSKLKDGSTQLDYAHQEWMVEMSEPDCYGVLILDDLPAAMPAIQAATRQLVHPNDRGIHGRRISDKVVIIVTGNRRQDKSGASTLPAHFRSSVMMLEIEPDLDNWCRWYGQQPGHDPIVAAFLRWKEGRLAMTPADASENGSFPTPRGWAMLGRQFAVAQKQGLLLEVASGIVGEGTAIEFTAFAKLRATLVDPEVVLKDPKKAIPNVEATFGGKPDHLIAVATGIAEVTARVVKNTKEEKVRDLAYLQFLRACSWLTQGSGGEYLATSVHTLTANLGGDSSRRWLEVAAKNKDDELVGGLISRLAKILR